VNLSALLTSNLSQKISHDGGFLRLLGDREKGEIEDEKKREENYI
jgi:hypothetical protein